MILTWDKFEDLLHKQRVRLAEKTKGGKTMSKYIPAISAIVFAVLAGGKVFGGKVFEVLEGGKVF